MSAPSVPWRVARRVAAVAAALALGLAGPALSVAAPPVGPPYPDPVAGQRVYDYAGAFRSDTVAEAESIIHGIEARTGAQVAVYTQDLGYKTTTEQAAADAKELMRQWGVGRKGFDDGLVILYDLDSSLVHGQVELWAGDGYRAAFLSDSERQSLYESQMLPLLEQGDMDGSLLVALRAIDANATPEHAASLETARQVNAVVGLVGAPVVLLVLVGWAFVSWTRYGRDPVYLDSPSIHVPAPPAGMTAAMGALVAEGGAPERAFTAALLDLAARGRIAFEEDPDADKEHRPAGSDRGFSILVGEKALDAAAADLEAGGERAAGERAVDAPVAEAKLGLSDRRPLGRAELELLRELTDKAGPDGAVSPKDVTTLGTARAAFLERIEEDAVTAGWFRERPHVTLRRWRIRETLEMVAGAIAIYAGFSIPMSGLTLVGGGLFAAGVLTIPLAEWMPARTMSGAMANAWLAAYRRTLEKTMEQAASITEVPKGADLGWLETPDMVAVWATALGLAGPLRDLLARSQQHDPASPLYYSPLWYRSPASAGGGGAGSHGFAGGLFSSSGVPDVGGMVSALGSIGNASAASASGGGGGGFGGGGGGGGGGAGGGF